MGVELPLRVVVTILECCVTFSGVKLSIRSFVLLFEQVGYSMFLVQYRKVFSDQYNFFERVDLAFALLYVYCVLRRMGGIFLLCIEETFD